MSDHACGAAIRRTCLAVVRTVAVIVLPIGASLGASFEPVDLRAPEPGGPPPHGAPVEVSVPFAQGKLPVERIDELTVAGSDGAAVPTQTRVVWRWPDGSVRWLFVTFDAVGGGGQYALVRGERPKLEPILREENGAILVDTGAVFLRVAKGGPGWFESIGARDAEGNLVDVVRGSASADMAITSADGTTFSSRLAKDQRITVEDNGAVCARVRLEGTCMSEEGRPLFDTIVRWQAFRGRSQLIGTVTWVNATGSSGERVRDMRIAFPYAFEPKRIVVGCDGGVYDAPFMKGNSYSVLQEDHDQYWARRRHTDGRVLNLATGGANGERCPGWLSVESDRRCVGVYVPGFWQEYPNELTADDSGIAVGLWPRRANEYLSHKAILPPHSDPKTRYRHTKYWPIVPHPYLAFFSKDDTCLDVPQGVAKTQRIVLDVWAGAGAGPDFETKVWAGALLPVRAHLEPASVAGTGVFGRVTASAPERFPAAERMMGEAFGWLKSHVDVARCYGKFDYGDFRYMTPSTTYVTCVGKWQHMQEMAREGYWHNNERDPLRGVLLHYFRTGDAAAFALGEAAAGHAFDVDTRHHPHWGMYTHSYGHCYRALGTGGAPDHAWLLGMLEWACVSGDPVLKDWVLRCGDRLAGMNPERYVKSDLRTTSMALHMASTFFGYTGDEKHLKMARRVAEILREAQLDSGLWMPYLSQPKKKHYITMAFVSHTLMALADYIDATGDDRLLPVLRRATDAYCGAGEAKWAVGEIGLTIPALDLLWRKTRDEVYVDFTRRVYACLCSNQCLVDDPRVRGEFWPQWATNAPGGKQRPGRPPQFTGQVRPLTPGTVLAYGAAGLRAIAESEDSQ